MLNLLPKALYIAFNRYLPSLLPILLTFYVYLQIKAYRVYGLYVPTYVWVCVTWLLLLLSLPAADPNAFVRYVCVNNARFLLLIRSNGNRGSSGPQSFLIFFSKRIHFRRHRRQLCPMYPLLFLHCWKIHLCNSRRHSSLQCIHTINIIPIAGYCM